MKIILPIIILMSIIYKQIIAYIDPGTGSIILQAIIGAAVGIAVSIKLFWHRILKYLGIRKDENSDEIKQDISEDKK